MSGTGQSFASRFEQMQLSGRFDLLLSAVADSVAAVAADPIRLQGLIDDFRHAAAAHAQAQVDPSAPVVEARLGPPRPGEGSEQRRAMDQADHSHGRAAPGQPAGDPAKNPMAVGVPGMPMPANTARPGEGSEERRAMDAAGMEPAPSPTSPSVHEGTGGLSVDATVIKAPAPAATPTPAPAEKPDEKKA